MNLTKSAAVEIFGTRASLAKAIGNSPSAVSMWKEVLTEVQADRVIAAAWRKRLLHCFDDYLPPATPAAAEAPAVDDQRSLAADGRAAEEVRG